MIKDPAIEAMARDDVWFASGDGTRLHGWLFRPPREGKGLCVFLHGYEDNISTHTANVIWLVEAGYGLFAIDYRGHGLSEGAPTMAGVNADALAAIDEAVRLQGAHSGRLFVIGQSMGGAIAAWAVANSPHKDRVTGLILDAAFSSYSAIARESLSKSPTKWPLRYFTFLLNDSYSPVLWIDKVAPVPVLIIHGEDDSTVAPYHARTLFDAARVPKALWIIKDKGHPRALTDEETRRRMLEYMDAAGDSGHGS